MIKSLKNQTKKKGRFKLFLKCFWTLSFHMTGAVYESVNVCGVPLNPEHMMKCVFKV